ncbi:MAG: tRNA uridine-5-carboxymethylaminomethyl(34) synthesis GTPase MnmE [Myxococcota bacterium]
MTTIDIARKDTICAPATPAGRSALAVIRVSGPASWNVLRRIFWPRHGKEIQPFVATVGSVKGWADGQAAHDVPLQQQPTVDEAVCVAYPPGRSYTGEAGFELSVHGNPLLVQAVLQLLQRVGCRLARAGEFSMRAVLSGKLDLCQAQGVYNVIHARSLRACEAALQAVAGCLSDQLQRARGHLVEALGLIEAQLDFPDDVEHEHVAAVREHLQVVLGIVDKLLASAAWGMRLQAGARVVLCGAPNAGKSTLLNALVDDHKALVHHRPGTTRDFIEVPWQIDGVAITLVDVAGLRNAQQAGDVERMGMQQAYKQLQRADVVLWLVDARCVRLQQAFAQPPGPLGNTPVIPLLTKADLCDHSCMNAAVSQQSAAATVNFATAALWISAHNGRGLQQLQQQLQRLLTQDSVSQQEPVLTTQQQYNLVQQVQQATAYAATTLQQNRPHEVVAALLREAGQAFDELLGSNLSEDVLQTIFSRFCIGK